MGAGCTSHSIAMYFDRRTLTISAIALLLTGHAVAGLAADPMPASAPQFCHPMTTAQRASWQSKMGHLLGDLHHYCFGVRDLAAAERPGLPAAMRAGKLTSAIDEFDYVLRSKNATPGHWFLPEVHLKRALALMKLGRYGESQAEYKRARIAEQQAAMARGSAR